MRRRARLVRCGRVRDRATESDLRRLPTTLSRRRGERAMARERARPRRVPTLQELSYFAWPGLTSLGGFAFPGVGVESRSVAGLDRCLLLGAERAVPRPSPTERPLGGPSPCPPPLAPTAAAPALPPPPPPPPPRASAGVPVRASTISSQAIRTLDGRLNPRSASFGLLRAGRPP